MPIVMYQGLGYRESLFHVHILPTNHQKGIRTRFRLERAPNHLAYLSAGKDVAGAQVIIEK